jgi:hypothetical protein
MVGRHSIRVAGSLHISSGPGFDIVMSANRAERLGIFPRMLFFHVLLYIMAGLAISWLAGALS